MIIMLKTLKALGITNTAGLLSKPRSFRRRYIGIVPALKYIVKRIKALIRRRPTSLS